MTDITELAQSLKAAAEKATPGQWMRSSVQFNSITDIANPMEQGNKPHIANTSEKRDAEFISLANPANILALVEALEKVQRQNGYLREQSAEWERKAISNFQESATMSERIYLLESRTVTVKLPPRKNATDYVEDEFSNEDLASIFNTCRLQCKVALEKALTAQGIKWEAE
ncbi:TPA: ead/Ea22-like family protein [Klebsiella aerogenes]